MTEPDPTTDGPRQTRPPTPLEVLDRYLPFLAVSAMVLTFLLIPPFAIPLIGLVWLVATRLTSNRRFLGLTLTEALAWSATIVIALLAIGFALYVLGAPTA